MVLLVFTEGLIPLPDTHRWTDTHTYTHRSTQTLACLKCTPQPDKERHRHKCCSFWGSSCEPVTSSAHYSPTGKHSITILNFHFLWDRFGGGFEGDQVLSHPQRGEPAQVRGQELRIKYNVTLALLTSPAVYLYLPTNSLPDLLHFPFPSPSWASGPAWETFGANPCQGPRNLQL